MSRCTPKLISLLGLLLVAVVPARAVDGLSLSISQELFQNCSTGDALLVRFENPADATRSREFRLVCATENAAVKLASVGRYAYVDSQWEAAAKWQITATGEWVTIFGVVLEPASYKLNAQWKQQSRPLAETVLEQALVFNAARGPSLRQIRIEQTSLPARLVGKYVTKDTVYGTLILLLIGSLGVAVRKKLEKLWEHLLDQLGTVGIRPLAVRKFRKKYSEYLFSGHRYLRLIGFAAAEMNPPELEEVFISLRVSPFDRARASETKHDRSIGFEHAVGQYDRLVILGAPGAGKTTTLSYVILQCLRNREGRFGLRKPLLPLYLPLRRLSSGNTSLLDDVLSPETQILPKDLIKECPKNYLKRELEIGRCLVLLDGLDEVVDDATHLRLARAS